MSLRRIPLLICMAALQCPAVLYGYSVTGADVLRIPAAARAQGMGGAYAAVADDAETVYYNPAGLGAVRRTEIPLVDNMLYNDIRQRHAGLVYSLRDVRSLNVEDLGALSAGYTTFENDAEPAVESSVLTASYGKPVFSSDLLGEFMLGANMHFVNEDLGGTGLSRESVDLGALWRTRNEKLAIGAAARNVGGTTDASDLPKDNIMGAAYKEFDKALVLAADVHSYDCSDYRISTGIELWLMNTIALRGGYNSDRLAGDAFTAGAGLSIKQMDFCFFYFHEVNIDYAFISYDELGDTHWVGVKIKLGAD